MQVADANAIARLVEQHGSALVLYARGLCDCPDDVVQEAFLKLVRQAEMPRQPAAWLFRVVRNLSLNAQRTRGRRRKHELSRGATEPAWFEPRPENRLVAGEAIRALSQLGREEHETVVARIWGQLTFEQIAELTKCSLTTAHRRYTAALERLRWQLNPEPKQPTPTTPVRHAEQLSASSGEQP